MSNITSNLFLVSIAFVIVIGNKYGSSSPIDIEKGIVLLKKSNFQKTIELQDFVLIEFYDPRCGDCQSFAPEYEKLSQEFRKKDWEVIPAKLDVTHERELAIQHNIQQVPTLIFYKKGLSTTYNGKLSLQEILKWIAKEYV